MNSNHVIIVAGGKGLRMGSEIPKQFLPVSGRPVLMHTIEAFYRFDVAIQIIVVLPREQQAYWNDICAKFNFTIQHRIVAGGDTRFHSVRNGLELVPEGVLVGIHDGVRPLVPATVIASCYLAAEEKGAAFPVIPVTDTLRKKTAGGSEVVDRADYCLVQTPQVFRSGIIREAYRQAYSEQFTDDVSVVETLGGYPVVATEGSRENIKITTLVDLMVAEAILAIRTENK